MSEFFQTAKENVSFLLVCLVVFAGLVLLAFLFEHLLIKDRHKLGSARSIAFVAMFSAIAAIIMLFDFPLLFLAPGFYEMDLSEIPVLICTFYLGPVAGVVTEMLKVILKLMLKGTSTAFVGDFANFVVGCSMVLPASILYHIHKSRKSAIWGLAAGTVIMAIFGSFFNAFYLLPKFAVLFHMAPEAIISMGSQINPHITSFSSLAFLAVAPFNIVKGLVVSVLTLLLYKRVERVFFRKKS